MSLTKFRNIFGKSQMVVIGMIHAKPLPGTPKSCHSIENIIENALKEANIYKEARVDSVLIENMHDLPYLHSKDFGPEVVASMTRVATEVRAFLPSEIPCGIQILAGGNKEALAVCKASELQFIRAEGFVFSHVADEGWMDSCAGNLLRYRKYINCDALIFADIKKKHSAHTVTSDVSLQETAKAAEFFLADGVILTGSATGEQANPQELDEVKIATKVPVLIGSGITVDNLGMFAKANGLIVGSHFKKMGRWEGELEPSKVEEFMKEVNRMREENGIH